MSPIGRVASFILVSNLLLIFPSAFWWVTGTNILPGPLIRHFDPDGEANLFAWYSSLLLILTSISALMNFGLDSIALEGVTLRRYAWLLICGATLLLSLEEVATIHESIQRFVRRQFQGETGWSKWAREYGRVWILVYSPMILVVIGSLFYIVVRLWQEHRGAALSALIGLTLWIAALGFEFSLGPLCLGTELEIRCAQGEVLLEEGSEIFGTSGLLIAFVWFAYRRAAPLLAQVRPHRSAG